MHIPAQVDTIGDGSVRLTQVGDDVARALVVVGVGNAIFGNHHWFAELAHPPQHVVQALWVDLPAKVGAFAGLTRAVFGPWPADDVAAVVIDADPVEPGHRAPQHSALPQPIADDCHGLIDWAPRAQRLHGPQRERHADHGIKTVRLQYLASHDVAARRVAHESNVAAQIEWPMRRPAAFDVRLHPQDARFVDGDPPLDQVAGLSGEVVGVLSQALDDVRIGPAAHVRQPLWAGEVVQRDHWLNVCHSQGIKDSTIVIDRPLVEATRLGFDARPLD